MYLLTGVVLLAVGTAGLYWSWRRLRFAGAWLVTTSWLVIGMSLWAWCAGLGAEIGLAAGLLGLSLCGGALVALNLELRRRRALAEAATGRIEITPRSWGRHLLLFVVSVPLAGAAAIIGSVYLCRLLPWHPTNEMALAVFLAPVVWGLAAFWACADPRPARPALACLAFAALPAGLLYL
ncbi:hypothetical protein E4634_02195 [Mangrovimicrobium sediminis]|uniref:Uncharacterized protein n=1 Tax=Mangrovimicrobium sediminis TaxID=2562682 RepID=A0A4Z0M7P6_9GAMM|nr:hypothetical protein [Haliea sp. SAOS-164]TGD75712.1 hypothetical protein E4634_02195 [Haliea sp. SAOS-164]